MHRIQQTERLGGKQSMNIQDIKELAKIMQETGITSLHLTEGALDISMERNTAAPAPAAASAAIPNTECFFFDIKITTFLKFAVTLFPAICVYSCFNFSNQLLSFLSFVS